MNAGRYFLRIKSFKNVLDPVKREPRLLFRSFPSSLVQRAGIRNELIVLKHTTTRQVMSASYRRPHQRQ